MKKLLALDCDGVLLNYNAGYGLAWRKAFGYLPELINPNAYWAHNMWGVKWLDDLPGGDLERLRKAFDEEFWSTLPAIEGAVEAANKLAKHYDLVCVTAIPSEVAVARGKNLRDAGFPSMPVYPTGVGSGSEGGKSPKHLVINELRPVAFVDDLASYLDGIGDHTHKALIHRNVETSPNVDKLHMADSHHNSLAEFTDWWLRHVE
jgi:hypothetical protein